MPRVGSSRINSRGWVASQRAIMAFCWLPPDSRPIGVSTLAVLMPSALDEALGQRGLLGARQEAAQRPAAPAAPARCSRAPTARPRCRRSCAPRGRAPGHGAIASAGDGEAHACAIDRQHAAVRRLQPEQQARQFRAARAQQARQPQHLARAHAQVQRVQLARLAQSLGFQQRRRTLVERGRDGAAPATAPPARAPASPRSAPAARDRPPAIRPPRRRCAAP